MTTRRRIRRKSCTGKVVHLTRGAAQKAKREIVVRGAARGNLNVYQCRFGAHFHVGRRPHQKKRRTTA